MNEDAEASASLASWKIHLCPAQNIYTRIVKMQRCVYKELEISKTGMIDMYNDFHGFLRNLVQLMA